MRYFFSIFILILESDEDSVLFKLGFFTEVFPLRNYSFWGKIAVKRSIRLN